MAGRGFLFTILFASFFCFTLCRRLPQRFHTAVLDVSSTIQTTRDVFSLKPEITKPLQKKEHDNTLSTSSSSLSSLALQVGSRVSLDIASHSDYKSLTMSRLERDSVRVRSLTAKLDLALKRVTNSDPRGFEEESIEGPVISGTTFGSGEYFSRVGIGRPAKEVYMVLDTGSDVNWVQCAPCADCYQQSDPIFEPASSSSYAPLSCETRQCKSLDISDCRNNTCLYEVSYGDGSYTVGDFVTETLTFDGSASVNSVAIGCGHSNEGLFVAAAGLLGLGGGSLSLPSQINASSYSYCLVDRDSNSNSTLEFDSAVPSKSVAAPLLRNHQLDTFLYLGLTGLSVGGEVLSIPRSSFQMDESGKGGIIVDSGTAITRLKTEVYDSLRDAFVNGTRNLKRTDGVALFDTCYDLSSKDTVEVPTVAFHFPGGNILPLPAKNYLIPVDSVGTFCFAFAPTSSGLSIIGNVQQQGTRVSFDLAKSRIAFSPNKC